MAKRRWGLVLLATALACGPLVVEAQGAARSGTTYGAWTSTGARAGLPALVLRAGAYPLPTMPTALDIGVYETGTDLEGGNALSAHTLWNPGSSPNDSKMQAAELTAEIADGNTALLTRNLAGLIVRSHYHGAAPGRLANIYGQHLLAGPERTSGAVGGVWGLYASAGGFGSASGHIDQVVGLYTDIYKDNPAQTIGRTFGIWVGGVRKVGDPSQEWAIYTSEGQVQFNGPLLLELSGRVKRVEEGPPDSAGPGYRALRVGN